MTNDEINEMNIVQRLECGMPGSAKRDSADDPYVQYTRSYLALDRYMYDLAMCAGWQQFDTTSDAWYFGIWLHPERLIYACYAEGDEVVRVFRTREDFAVEIDRLRSVYKQPPMACGYGPDGVTNYYSDRLTGDKIRAFAQETA